MTLLDEIIERFWILFWRALGVFVVCVTIPLALLVGCRALGLITRVSP